MVQESRPMPTLALFRFRFARLLFSGHAAVAAENAALRLQLAVMYVRADTVVRWQRERFRRYWARLSRGNRRRRGRPATAVEIRRLIDEMATANPLWRAPRIHGE